MIQGDALSALLLNFSLEYAIRKLQETNLRLDMKDNHQVLAYSDDVNSITDYMRTVERYALLNDCKVIGLAVNTRKSKYMEEGRHRGLVANEHITGGRNSYEKLKTFKYLGSLLTDQNSIRLEMKCRLKAGYLCYYLVQAPLSSRLQSRKLKIKIGKTVIV